ncbi:MAG: hypothetical protein ACOC32_03705, partial [Nanoarchaeota archaeon]
MKRALLFSLVFFLLATTWTGAFLFDDADEEFDLDDYVVDSEGDFRYGENDPDKDLAGEGSGGNLFDQAIDPEDDLNVDEMENII